ncbi:MAG TPA: macrolide ABC transporter ATP-binding protein, partial [Gemmatimonadaceae bacterium]|nr:macrolide ABC transporter ATP-binding protein [Gemmatimonadaceae bacterium]
DSRTAEDIMQVFAGLVAEGQTVIVVTHEPAIAARAQRTIVLRDGQIERDAGRTAPMGEAQ